MKRKKVLIASEVREELIDVFNLVKDKDVNLFIFLSSNIDFSEDGDFSVYKEKKISDLKIVQKIYGLICFLRIVFKFRPDIIFSGSSMLKYRLISKIFSVFHIAYFRAVLFDSSNRSGICDRLYYSGLGKIGFLKNILCAFYADLVIVTSERSRRFISERSDDISIISCNPIWLDQFEKIEFSKNKVNRFIFLTQAFDSHGFLDQHNSQVSSLKILDKYCFENGYELTVRLHPRDYFDYHKLELLSKVFFDKSHPSEFLSKKEILSCSIVISPLSTFAFEIIYIGGNVAFYSSESLDEVYGKSYRDLGMVPMVINDGFCFSDLEFNNSVSIFSESNEEFKIKMDSIF